MKAIMALVLILAILSVVKAMLDEHLKWRALEREVSQSQQETERMKILARAAGRSCFEDLENDGSNAARAD